jgi:hypothetical protein
MPWMRAASARADERGVGLGDLHSARHFSDLHVSKRLDFLKREFFAHECNASDGIRLKSLCLQFTYRRPTLRSAREREGAARQLHNLSPMLARLAAIVRSDEPKSTHASTSATRRRILSHRAHARNMRRRPTQAPLAWLRPLQRSLGQGSLDLRRNTADRMRNG